MRYEVHDEELEATLHALATMIKAGMPEGCGFALFLFKYTDNPDIFYMSSAVREDMVAMLQDFIDKERRRAIQ